ncbi:PREDICTED: uncharacterized protein LOC109160078 [Ipomoea nil]|uniref:uncharacterized protein LOC109160078 n=1 Tax=Ipomoea nil TaxID=35883 RepID=UPI0009012C85|nr:PREDICTED: uncharacterized protein LOC109160078 [Ipomoea nil]
MADSYTSTTSDQQKQEVALDIGNLMDLTSNRGIDNGKEIEISSYEEYPRKRIFYKPSLVSIGPKYSKEVDQVKDKEYKNIYMKSFLERDVGHSVDEYRGCLRNPEMKLLDKAENYYKEIEITYPHTDEELVDMLLLDGCFVVEFVLKCKEGGNGDPRRSFEGKKAREDMLLFENQLPFDVLSAIYKKMTTGNTDEVPSFIRLVKFAFASLAPKFTINNFHDDNKPQQPMDLLHVVYSLCLPSNAQTLVSQAAKGNEENMWLKLNHMNSATELKEVGVRFDKIGQVFNMPKKYENIPSPEYSGAISLFDITFHNGVMTIPCFKVDNFTELFFRNMIAMEQRCDTLNPKYFTDYTRLMDHLLDTKRDVTLLRKNGIIQNLLDEDNKVAYIFNNLSVEVDTSTNFYFASVYTAVNKLCRKRSHVWKQKLKKFFYALWKVLSITLSAISLLLLVVEAYNNNK